MKKIISIVKVGGAFLEEEALLNEITTSFAAMQGPKILVHGGGQKASRISNALGIAPKMVDGRRITDAESLEVVTMVYAGWANKTLVARLQSLGCNAIGVSGSDANLILAKKRAVETIDYGFVGDVEEVNTSILETFLESGLIPVFCALTHNGNGQLLNTNADTIAAEIAIALGREHQTRLFYCFEKQGVLRDTGDPESTIPLINTHIFEELKEQGIIVTGMVPKLFNCFQALQRGVNEVFIGPSALLNGKAGKFTKIRL